MADDVVHVHLNEGRAQFFRPMDNGRADEWTYPVPRTVWEPFVEAERQVEAAEANLTAALQRRTVRGMIEKTYAAVHA